MRDALERKIVDYKAKRQVASDLQSLIEEKRRNLHNLLQEELTESAFDAADYQSKIEAKQKEYEEQYQRLHADRMKVIEMSSEVQAMQLDLNLQLQGKATIQQQIQQLQKEMDKGLEEIERKQEHDRKEVINCGEEGCARHLAHIEQLCVQKSELLEKSSQYLEQRKAFQEEKKKMKQHFAQDLRKQKEVWMKQEKEKREKWQSKKYEEIMENTLKGIQPQIKRIVSSSKEEISKIQEKYKELQNKYQSEMQLQFEAKVKQHRQLHQTQLQSHKSEVLQRANDSLRKRLEKLDQEYESDRVKLKRQKDEEIKELEEQRKRETQQFISQNKDYLLAHYEEVRKIKDTYEKEIADLEGSLAKMTEKEEKTIAGKFNRMLEEHRENSRKQLEKRIKQFHADYKLKMESSYQDLVEKVACENQLYESQVRLNVEQKLRESKESNEAEVKKIKKHSQALEAKLSAEKEAEAEQNKQLEECQGEYDTAHQQNEYLKRKLQELQRQILLMKAGWTEEQQSGKKELEKLDRQWSQQNELIRHKIANVEQQILEQEQIMRVKSQELRASSTGLLNQLQRNSLQLIKKQNEQITRLRQAKEYEIANRKGLEETKKKLILKYPSLVTK